MVTSLIQMVASNGNIVIFMRSAIVVSGDDAVSDGDVTEIRVRGKAILDQLDWPLGPTT